MDHKSIHASRPKGSNPAGSANTEGAAPLRFLQGWVSLRNALKAVTQTTYYFLTEFQPGPNHFHDLPMRLCRRPTRIDGHHSLRFSRCDRPITIVHARKKTAILLLEAVLVRVGPGCVLFRATLRAILRTL